MDSKQEKDLEKAKKLFFNWRLLEAYQIFRRYFDRLPFKAEPGHAEYIGYFSRTLLELGKDYELKFYLNEIEKLYESYRTPELAYQLAGIYCAGPHGTRNYKAAKTLLEDVIRECKYPKIVVRAKLLLAFAYDADGGDTASCRKIIDSVTDPVSEELDGLWQVWKAKILRDEKNYVASEKLLRKILLTLKPTDDWRTYFYARNILAIQHIRTGEIDKAKEEIKELKAAFEKRKLNSIKNAILQLEAEVEKQKSLGTVQFLQNEEVLNVQYRNRTYALKNKSAAEKLLMALARKGFLDRQSIVRLLFNRQYDPKNDDKTVYYHIHALRKLVSKFGIPPEAISLEENGYRLLPEVKFLEV